MTRKLLYGLSLFVLLATCGVLVYKLRQEKQFTLNLKEAYSRQQESRYLRAKADSLLDVKSYEEALYYYARVDSSRGSDLTQQHATHVISLFESQKKKSDSLYQLNHNLKVALKAEFSRLMQAQHTTDTIRIKLDSLFAELNSLRDEIHKADLREVSLIDSLKQWQANHQFSQFFIDDSVKVYYLGPIENNMANGFGYGIITAGGVYEGEWRDNRRHGKGKYTWRNGHIYEGDFFEGRIEGFGTYTFPSGERYTGNWKDNLREGKGTLYNETGNTVLDGQWVKDKYKGGR